MKVFTLIAGFLLCSFFVSARIIVVNNNNPSPSQFSNLQTAIDSASTGDTLYIQGSLTSYGNAAISKRLVMLGAGYRPDKQNPLPSILGVIALDSITTGASAGASASGTVMMGFEINKLGTYNNQPLRNLLIKRNHFIKNAVYNFGGLTLNAVNSTFEQNLFDSNSVIDFDLDAGTGCLVRNNLIGCTFRNSYGGTVLINNIFLSTSDAFYNVSNALIANNIFYSAAPQGCSNCNFTNNLTYGTSNNTIPYGSNTGSGNFLSTDPACVSITQYTFNYSQDYHLQSASPAKNAGTDGTDLGIYGGGAPMPAFGGEPPIPQIKQLSVSPVVKKNTNLQIQIKAKKQD